MSEADFGEDYELARRMHGALWAAGDYTRVAEQLTGVSAAVVEAAGIGAGMRVLDLGAGSGNTALLAAGRGAEVTAVDLTDDLFGTCRQRAAAAGVTVTWAATNPEDLPFGAGDFDRVLSAVGGPLAMAPNQRRVAAEMVRVCRPGGVLAMASWTAEGLVGQAARVIASYLPPPPPGAPSPWAWAGEDSVKALLGPFGYVPTLARRMATFRYRSPESYLSYLEEVHGPTIVALRLAARQGRRAELSAGLFELYSGANTATDGTLAFEQEYLLATATARVSRAP
jgi:2-polyprenyl-6-hydroxyphenyl methylase/3-demethylubiquinone-9 3-methyltransferase